MSELVVHLLHICMQEARKTPPEKPRAIARPPPPPECAKSGCLAARSSSGRTEVVDKACRTQPKDENHENEVNEHSGRIIGIVFLDRSRFYEGVLASDSHPTCFKAKDAHRASSRAERG